MLFLNSNSFGFITHTPTVKGAEKYKLSPPWGTSPTILEWEPEHEGLQGHAGGSPLTQDGAGSEGLSAFHS